MVMYEVQLSMKMLIVALTLGAGLIAGDVQGLSQQDIVAAIEQGTAGKTLQKKCSAYGDNGMDFVAMGPIGRIMQAAREARRRNTPFTAADVTPAMAAPLLTVTAIRDRTLQKTVQEAYQLPGTAGGVAYRTWFVIKSKAPRSEEPIVLEPVGAIRYDSSKTASRRVVLGGQVPDDVAPLPGSDMAASFDLAAFKAIPHQDVEIVAFMTDTGEHKCKINEKERKALR